MRQAQKILRTAKAEVQKQAASSRRVGWGWPGDSVFSCGWGVAFLWEGEEVLFFLGRGGGQCCFCRGGEEGGSFGGALFR